jgi:cardiolipin synthase
MNKWVGGNQFTLLENGEDFFPACLNASPERAGSDAETFIWFDDKVGRELQVAIAAGQRGV